MSVSAQNVSEGCYWPADRDEFQMTNMFWTTLMYDMCFSQNKLTHEVFQEILT